MKYLDTVIENVDRLKKARVNINRYLIFMTIVIAVFLFLGLFISLIDLAFGLMCYVASLAYLILLTGLILKREIYSIAILIKGGK